MSTVTLALQTRACTQLSNAFNDDAVNDWDRKVAEDYRKKHNFATPRPTELTYGYNCHGLTFGSRRAQIDDPLEIRKGLSDDRYVRINMLECGPGDVVIYIASNGDINHSGVIIENRPEPGLLAYEPLVLSKWGSAEEYTHRLYDHPYAKNVEFYRVVR